jgi:hypothetical protein
MGIRSIVRVSDTAGDYFPFAKICLVFMSAILAGRCAAAAAQQAAPVQDRIAQVGNEVYIDHVAPNWPFRGFFDPVAGRFWDTKNGRVHDVGTEARFGDCLEEYVEVNESAVWLGYRSYFDPLRTAHFVIPWGDVAFPIIGPGIVSINSSSSQPSDGGVDLKSQLSAATRIDILPARTIRSVGEQEGGDISYVVGFEAVTSSERSWYRPIGSHRGIVKHQPKSEAIVEELDTLFRENDNQRYFDDVYISGSDGRYYALTMYDIGHPMCHDIAHTLLIDGESGAVVSCHEVQLERVTPLVFVAADNSEQLDKFVLPDAASPIGLDNCPVRIDHDPLSFFSAVLDDSPEVVADGGNTRG